MPHEEKEVYDEAIDDEILIQIDRDSVAFVTGADTEDEQTIEMSPETFREFLPLLKKWGYL